MNATVVLVHGLWMHGIAMIPLARRLEARGFACERFSYRSVRRGLEANSGALLAHLRRLPASSLHLVGHSLGGALILHALNEWADSRIRRVLLLGSPVTGSMSGRALARYRAGRRMLGASLPLWDERRVPSAPEGVEVGVIAGSLPIGLGRLFTVLPEPNDGVVPAVETRVDGAADSLLLRVNHTGMLFSAAVARQAYAFLKDGRFARD